MDGREIVIKADKSNKYASFRQCEINKWAINKEDSGMVHNGDRLEGKARFKEWE